MHKYPLCQVLLNRACMIWGYPGSLVDTRSPNSGHCFPIAMTHHWQQIWRSSSSSLTSAERSAGNANSAPPKDVPSSCKHHKAGLLR